MAPSAPPTAAAARAAKLLLQAPFSSSPAHLSMSTTSSTPLAPRLAAAAGTAPSLLTADPGHRDAVLLAARAAMGNCLGETRLDLAVPGLRLAAKGKVRDVYESGEHLVLVTTDRQSAFDRVLASIPFKGQVLNETSLWWFDRTRHITPNAVVSSPDKNVTIAKRCSVFPVEFVVRGYVTGSTDTSLWTVYNKGVRNYCGNVLPDDMVKNQKLSTNILTSTTKAVDHDVPVTPDEIISSRLMSKEDFDEARSKALRLFEYGQVFVVGHDWGAIISWYLCLFRPDRVIALVNTSVAFMRPIMIRAGAGAVKTTDYFRHTYGPTYYICRFQEPSITEKEFIPAHARHMVKRMFCTRHVPKPAGAGGDQKPAAAANEADSPPVLPSWVTEADVDYFVAAFEKTGFTGPINYYRNMDRNWELAAPWADAKVTVPTKFIVGDGDLTYHYPGIQDYIHKGGFKADVPLLEDVVVIPGAGHFIQQEEADEVSKHIHEFIAKF